MFIHLCNLWLRSQYTIAELSKRPFNLQSLNVAISATVHALKEGMNHAARYRKQRHSYVSLRGSAKNFTKEVVVHFITCLNFPDP